MIVYRYEKPDKGGVFFTLDGINRLTNVQIFDNWISGCESVESLMQWFSERNINTDDCIIVSYNVPKEAIKYTKTHLVFPKKYISN